MTIVRVARGWAVYDGEYRAAGGELVAVAPAVAAAWLARGWALPVAPSGGGSAGRRGILDSGVNPLPRAQAMGAPLGGTWWARTARLRRLGVGCAGLLGQRPGPRNCRRRCRFRRAGARGRGQSLASTYGCSVAVPRRPPEGSCWASANRERAAGGFIAFSGLRAGAVEPLKERRSGRKTAAPG